MQFGTYWCNFWGRFKTYIYCFRFYKLCRAWVTDVKKNKQANIEKLKFEESDVMVEMLRSLEKDLGVHVSLEEADLMYLMCNFDLAWDPATIR